MPPEHSGRTEPTAGECAVGGPGMGRGEERRGGRHGSRHITFAVRERQPDASQIALWETTFPIKQPGILIKLALSGWYFQ